MRTRSASESAPILVIILARCAFTVRSVVPSSAPTCLFNRPVVISVKTSCSRGSQRALELFHLDPPALFRAPFAREPNAASNRVQQSLIVNRLFEEIYGALPHSMHSE